MRYNLLHWKGLFLTGLSEKGYQFQNVEHTVKGKFCGPLFTHWYTVDQQAPPGLLLTLIQCLHDG